MKRLRQLVPESWRAALADVLAAPSFLELERFLDEECRTCTVLPPRERIFAALEATPPEAVKVVVLGQDPYPTAGNANGLAFSVMPGVKVPASLKNIFAGVQADVGGPLPKSGDLSPWARQGVLLLNTVLTVREGAPSSHARRGWEALTAAVVQRVQDQRGPVVFLSFGNHAAAVLEGRVDLARHRVLQAPHPSPLNGRKFVETVGREKLFSRANEALAAAGRAPIVWRLP
jgi:uracil-DNA glycosylase